MMNTVPRLLEEFKPSHYDLDITLDGAAKTFLSTTTISGTLLESAHRLRLHCVDMDVASVLVDEAKVSFSLEDGLLLIGEAAEIKAGEHIIRVTSSGAITDPMHGLYPCRFEFEGAQEELLATQFESHHAREVFPCVDEPAAKATFNVTLRTIPGVTVLGNMPVKSSAEQDGQLTTSFETTPRMSTYLVAFVAGKMNHRSAHSKSGVEVNIWAAVNQPQDQLVFAAGHAADTIDFFNDYFQTAYPLPKCDFVALPDFSSGAMENWGLITHRETTLLVDEKNSGVAQKQYVASVITHELSHQWFGNLVTMKWWDDLWLNESFATIMEYVGVNGLHPEWDVWLNFGIDERAPSLSRDMLHGVQAIHTDVNHPDEISTLFDPSIVYAKGASVVNMVRSFVGDEAFREGLRMYFKKHAYSNTTSGDLWDAMSSASGQDVASFAEAWINKPGYPVLRVTQAFGTLQLEQQRVLAGHDDKESLWPIPLFATPSLSGALISTRSVQYAVDNDVYRLFNAGSNGSYVTHYMQPPHRKYLAEQFTAKAISPADRLRLLQEAVLLARTGEQSLVDGLDLALHAGQEDRDAVWDVIGMAIADSRRFIEHDEALLTALKRRVAALVSPGLGALGLTAEASDTAETRKRRAGLYALGVWSEQSDALAHALAAFDSFTTPGELDPDMKGIVYSAGAKHKGTLGYEKLFELYRKTTSAEERQELAGGMTATKDQGVIDTLFAHIKDPAIVRKQDAMFWFVYLMRKAEARDKAWAWLQREWPWIEDNYKSDKSYDYFPRYASGALFGQEWLAAYQTFFEPKMQQPALKRVISVGIEEISARTAWYERDEPRLRQYLSQTD